MTVFIASPGTETLPVRMFLYIQDNIDPLVTSVSAGVIVITMIVLIVLDRSTASTACSPASAIRGARRPCDMTSRSSAAACVGAAIAWGLGRRASGSSCSTRAISPSAPRAANFALVWVQSKGLGMPAYTGVDGAGVRSLGRSSPPR